MLSFAHHKPHKGPNFPDAPSLHTTAQSTSKTHQLTLNANSIRDRLKALENQRPLGRTLAFPEKQESARYRTFNISSHTAARGLADPTPGQGAGGGVRFAPPPWAHRWPGCVSLSALSQAQGRKWGGGTRRGFGAQSPWTTKGPETNSPGSREKQNGFVGEEDGALC